MRKNPADSAVVLLSIYSFESHGVNLRDLVLRWLSLYPSKWVVAAVVEAIYQGRYKVESVSRILNAWYDRGYPAHHFDYDFADVVCKKLAQLNTSPDGATSATPASSPTALAVVTQVPAFAQRPINPPPPALGELPLPPLSLNTPNRNITHCERLVVHLSA